MIKTLQKNISRLLLFFLGLLWSALLLSFYWSNYRQNLAELKSDVYQTIHEAGWNDFFESGGENTDLGDLEYCVFAVDDERNVTMQNNRFHSISEEKLFEYGRKLAAHWKGTENYRGVTYIYGRTRKAGRFLIVFSVAQAREESLPILIGCIVAGVFGLLLLWMASKKLSRWMVCPIEEMLESEKAFMSNASHELKTPLTVIKTNAELLSGEIGENRHLQYIRQETDRMNALVGKMLTLVRLDAPCIEPVQEHFLADEVLFEVIYPMESVAYEKQIGIETDIPEGLPMTGDPEQLRTVMTILLDNAISYTKEGGKIRIAAWQQGEKFHLLVANTGEEIPPEQREQLFERFFRADEARGDAEQHFGLGLSIASRIVKKQHGKIQVESRNGENLFHVTIPLHGIKHH
jgi:signal transduction histidine kinase